jgi:DNA-binding Xre family transcriptional regulator
METTNSGVAWKVNIILTALDIDKTELAEEIGVDRTNLSRVLSGERRTKRIQKKVVEAICKRIDLLIIGEQSGEESEAKAA